MHAVVEPLEIGLCSWSLQTDDAAVLTREVGRFGLRALHLALGSMIALEAEARARIVETYRSGPVLVSAGMIGFAGEDYSSLATIHRTGGYVPDEKFEERFTRTVAAAKVAQALGVKLLTTHAGFIPEKADAAAFEKLLGRLRRIADALGELGITLCFETGQETATTLADFLTALKRDNVGVNFDPANMILYGKGNPVDAVIRLAPWIQHVHGKDARRTEPKPTDANAWCGTEVPLGTGDARLGDVVSTLWRCGYRGAIAIEREAGKERGKDVATGISFLQEAVRRATGA